MVWDYAADIVANCFRAGLLVPLEHELIFSVMRLFGDYNLYLAGALAAFGASLGGLANYGIGWLAWLVHRRTRGTEMSLPIMQAKRFFQKFGPILILFSWLPLLHLAVPLAGFLGEKPRRVLPYLLVGQVAYFWALAVILPGY